MRIHVLPSQVVSDHVDTLQSDDGESRAWGAIVGTYALPIVAGASAFWPGVTVYMGSEILAGVAIFAGFVFGLMIFVFQLRLQAGSDPRIHEGDALIGLLDDLYHNVSYTALVGIITGCALGIAVGISKPGEPLSMWWTFGALSLCLHFVLTMLMCIRRTSVAYSHLSTTGT